MAGETEDRVSENAEDAELITHSTKPVAVHFPEAGGGGRAKLKISFRAT